MGHADATRDGGMDAYREEQRRIIESVTEVSLVTCDECGREIINCIGSASEVGAAALFHPDVGEPSAKYWCKRCRPPITFTLPDKPEEGEEWKGSDAAR